MREAVDALLLGGRRTEADQQKGIAGLQGQLRALIQMQSAQKK